MPKVPKIGIWQYFCNILRKKYCNCFWVLLWSKTFRYIIGVQSCSLLVNFMIRSNCPDFSNKFLASYIFFLDTTYRSVCLDFLWTFWNHALDISNCPVFANMFKNFTWTFLSVACANSLVNIFPHRYMTRMGKFILNHLIGYDFPEFCDGLPDS